MLAKSDFTLARETEAPGLCFLVGLEKDKLGMSGINYPEHKEPSTKLEKRILLLLADLEVLSLTCFFLLLLKMMMSHPRR